MEKRFRNRMALLLNIILAALEVTGLYISCRTSQKSIFLFYTQDSNILALLGCLPLITSWLAGKQAPKWAQRLRYISVCCVTVTFLVVLFVLVPMEGEGGARRMFLDGAMLYMHLLCPLLALANFIFFEDTPALRKGDIVRAIVPTVVYALVMIVLNLLRIVDGPYPFLRIYEQPLIVSLGWSLIIIGGAAVVAVIVYALHHCIACKFTSKSVDIYPSDR